MRSSHQIIGITLTLVWALCPTGAEADASLEHALIKIQPDAPHLGSDSFAMHAARNEYESFQVVLNGPMTGVSVTVSALTGFTATIPADSVRCSRVAYLNIIQTSNDEGLTGRVPDALIPDVDLYFGETRNAFPIDVPAGENRLVWVDVFVPPGTPAGEYAGVVTVSSDGGDEILDLTLSVWGFTLPSTSSLASAFGFEGWGNLFGHFDDPHNHYDDIVPLAQLYVSSGLMHRITLESMLIEDWDLYAETIDWPAFDARWGAFFDGTDLPFGLEGARVTSVRLPTWGSSDAEWVAYWSEIASHFRTRGWFDLLFDYTLDEPGDDPADYQEIIDRAALVHQANADLRVLVTTDIQEAEPYDVEDVIDVWVPVINFMHGKPYEVCWQQDYEGDQRADYDDLVAAGNELWWYQSCMSHGCWEDPASECFRHWPSYMVDHTAIRNRIMGWMSYRYDISGELYFDVNYSYGVAGADPWQDQFYFDGNGDGTLFYPGRPDRVGGATHIPIESVRLKHIRDGLEDYEYLLLLENQSNRDTALAELAPVVTSTFEYAGNPATLINARIAIGQRLDTRIFADGFESDDLSAWSSSEN